jgi:GNAT superfamily N-acetyltransferase
MHIRQGDGWLIQFKPERLPRALEIAYPPDDARLRAALPTEHGFFVATRKDAGEIMGYLTMLHDRVHQAGFVSDVVVSRAYRRHGIGARLLKVAARWAKEHGLTRLILETQTKNYPAIQFCQASGFTFCGFNDRWFPNQDIAVFYSQSLR